MSKVCRSGRSSIRGVSLAAFARAAPATAEALQRLELAQPCRHRPGRRAYPALAGRDVRADAGGRGHLGTVADGHIITDSRVSAEHDKVADRNTTGDTNLPGDQAMATDHRVVADLHLIVDLGP